MKLQFCSFAALAIFVAFDFNQYALAVKVSKSEENLAFDEVLAQDNVIPTAASVNDKTVAAKTKTLTAKKKKKKKKAPTTTIQIIHQPITTNHIVVQNATISDSPGACIGTSSQTISTGNSKSKRKQKTTANKVLVKDKKISGEKDAKIEANVQNNQGKNGLKTKE